jgi:hypothetical protein
VPVRVHIDRLVLDGIDVRPERAAALRALVEGELARALSAGGGEHWTRDVAVRRVHGVVGGGRIAGDERAVAGEVARAVARALGTAR